MSARNVATDENARRWNEWLNGPGQILTRLPIPAFALLDNEHLQDFIFDCWDHFDGPDFSTAVLSDIEAKTLLDFLDEFLSPEDKTQSWLYRELCSRLGIHLNDR